MVRKFFNKKITLFSAVALICLLLVFLSPEGFFRPVRNVFLTAVYPFQKIFYLMGKSFSGSVDFIKSISEMKNENEKLLRENNSLRAETAALGEVKRENGILREQLNLAPRQKFNLEAAAVIAQNPQKIGSWIIIDKGKSSGIDSGMPVIVDSGILIGKIFEVSGNSARVELLSDSESAVNVLDLENGGKGILKGVYGLGLAVSLISTSEIINVGDTIVTSGLGSEMPKGLLVGSVQDVRLSEDKLFQQAIVAPAVKYSNLDIVFVLKN